MCIKIIIYIHILFYKYKTIDILESRTYDFLENYFSKFTLQERLNVEIVSMDLYSPFKRVVKDKLQHATIIADTFHFTRIATEPLESGLKMLNVLQLKSFLPLLKL